MGIQISLDIRRQLASDPVDDCCPKAFNYPWKRFPGFGALDLDERLIEHPSALFWGERFIITVPTKASIEFFIDGRIHLQKRGCNDAWQTAGGRLRSDGTNSFRYPDQPPAPGSEASMQAAFQSL